VKKLSRFELHSFLEEKVRQFNNPSFIEQDPISIPHLFAGKADIEIAGFLTALIAWGQRPVILRNTRQWMQRMDDRPGEFMINHSWAERKKFGDFVHRTMNGEDAIYLLKALQKTYRDEGGLEGLFSNNFAASGNLAQTISATRRQLLSYSSPARTAKHLADPLRNSSAKRICMFLRWMVRKDKCGVDFGIWSKIPASALCCPLDLHSGRVARSLHLLTRTQDDWKAVEELTANLRTMDPADPVKYDFALFGLGAIEGFK
jgi:uncharacterized protein (TIGR02757 family)